MHPGWSLVDFRRYIVRNLLKTNATWAYSVNNTKVKLRPTRELHLRNQAHLLDVGPKNLAEDV